MSSITAIDIVSRALIKIGANPISSFDEPTREAEVAGNLYDGIRDSELTTYLWNFATQTVELNREDVTPLDKSLPYVYQLPSDHLRTRHIFNTSGNNVGYLEEGNKIYCDETRAFIRYLYRAPESKFPEFFIDSLVARLAWEFAEPVNGEDSVEDKRAKEYQFKYKRARLADAHSNPPIALITPENSRIHRARFGAGW